jgi:hypothetical protein
MRVLRYALVAGLVGSALAGCDTGTGYVEIKTMPVSPTAQPVLVLDSTRLDPVRKGQALLSAKVGSHKLQIDGPAGPFLLCDLVVRKDRITTVTVSVLDRPPRCHCRNTAGTDPPANRTCVS